MDDSFRCNRQNYAWNKYCDINEGGDDPFAASGMGREGIEIVELDDCVLENQKGDKDVCIHPIWWVLMIRILNCNISMHLKTSNIVAIIMNIELLTATFNIIEGCPIIISFIPLQARQITQTSIHLNWFFLLLLLPHDVVILSICFVQWIIIIAAIINLWAPKWPPTTLFFSTWRRWPSPRTKGCLISPRIESFTLSLHTTNCLRLLLLWWCSS